MPSSLHGHTLLTPRHRGGFRQIIASIAYISASTCAPAFETKYGRSVPCSTPAPTVGASSMGLQASQCDSRTTKGGDMQVLRDEALASAARDSRIRGHEASQSRRGRVKSLAVFGLAVVSVGLAVWFVSQTWPFAGSASHGAGTLQGTLSLSGVAGGLRERRCTAIQGSSFACNQPTAAPWRRYARTRTVPTVSTNWPAPTGSASTATPVRGQIR